MICRWHIRAADRARRSELAFARNEQMTGGLSNTDTLQSLRQKSKIFATSLCTREALRAIDDRPYGFCCTFSKFWCHCHDTSCLAMTCVFVTFSVCRRQPLQRSVSDVQCTPLQIGIVYHCRGDHRSSENWRILPGDCHDTSCLAMTCVLCGIFRL